MNKKRAAWILIVSLLLTLCAILIYMCGSWLNESVTNQYNGKMPVYYKSACIENNYGYLCIPTDNHHFISAKKIPFSDIYSGRLNDPKFFQNSTYSLGDAIIFYGKILYIGCVIFSLFVSIWYFVLVPKNI